MGSRWVDGRLVKDYTSIKYAVPKELVDRVMSNWKDVHSDSLYDMDTRRERFSSALSRTRSYSLRVHNILSEEVSKTTSAQDIVDCKDTFLFQKFPAVRELIHWTTQQYDSWSKLGRVFITRLDPSASIDRHVDRGLYFDSLHRHHLVLDSKGADFCWDGLRTRLHQGELWVVNNSIPHWVENSNRYRTHLIFDGA